MSANPYAAPQTTPAVSMPTTSASVAKGKKLFAAKHVALAAFLGMPVAGAAVLAVNFSRLGRTTAAVTSLVFGLLSSVALIAVAFMLPFSLPTGSSTLIGIGYALLMQMIAKETQGEELKAHTAAGGAIASGWAAAGIGVLALAVELAAIVVLVVGFNLG